jgi:hypothetical protein
LQNLKTIAHEPHGQVHWLLIYPHKELVTCKKIIILCKIVNGRCHSIKEHLSIHDGPYLFNQWINLLAMSNNFWIIEIVFQFLIINFVNKNIKIQMGANKISKAMSSVALMMW